jgi:hypothetical protein
MPLQYCNKLLMPPLFAQRVVDIVIFINKNLLPELNYFLCMVDLMTSIAQIRESQIIR